MKQTPSMILTVLAALLHDVGKFAQRANAPFSHDLEQEYCPPGQYGSTHKHVLYTDYFIEHELLLPPELEREKSCLARLASVHHRPDETVVEEKCICRADRLSSGGDRIQGQADGSYKKARLESIFSSVRLKTPEEKHNDIQQSPLRYRLLPLDAGVEQSIFPTDNWDNSSYDYKQLYDQFKAALKNLPLDMGVHHYLSSLASLLECYTWCIPSSTYGTRADISLYDHSWTTASISQALLAQPQTGTPKLILFGGDLSGIQKFIFGTEDTSAKGMNKLLRARSFLLQALVRSVWLTLLERLNLTLTAKIMDAGGRFVLLLPATDEVMEQLDILEPEVEKYMLEHFQGVLRLTFARLPIEAEDLERTRFRTCFDTFNDSLEQAKLQPFSRLMNNHVSPILPVDHEAYANNDECPTCRLRPASGKEEDGERSPCKQCRALIEVGKKLPTAHYVVISHKMSDKNLLLFGGFFARLQENRPTAADREAVDIVNLKDFTGFSAAPLAGYTPVVKPEDLERWREQGCFGGKQFTEEECEAGSPKTLGILALESRIKDQQSDSWRGLPALAALKADVDNLGILFSIGFGGGEESAFSLSRFAMLSRMLNHFFASHLTRVIEREFPNIYVVFAGGDDLFVLGPWADIINFALRLHEDFKKFAGDNPDVSLSAGLPLFKPGLPMRGIHHMAKETETEAKNFPEKNPEKNAVSLFGVTCHWDDCAKLLEQGKWLETLCLEGKITQGLVRRLLGYARDCYDFRVNRDLKKGLYLSHLSYDLARNLDEKKMDAQDVEKLKSLGHQDNFPTIVVSATWALYRTRTSA